MPYVILPPILPPKIGVVFPQSHPHIFYIPVVCKEIKGDSLQSMSTMPMCHLDVTRFLTHSLREHLILSTKEVLKLYTEADVFGISVYSDESTIINVPRINVLASGVHNPGSVLDVIDC